MLLVPQKTLVLTSVCVCVCASGRTRSIYDMTLLSFLIAFGHFSSEILIFRTAKIPGPALSPVIVSSAWRFPPYTSPQLEAFY